MCSELKLVWKTKTVIKGNNILPAKQISYIKVNDTDMAKVAHETCSSNKITLM